MSLLIKDGFLSILLVTLDPSLLRNLLTCKEVKKSKIPEQILKREG